MIPDYLREFTLVMFVLLLCFNQTFSRANFVIYPKHVAQGEFVLVPPHCEMVKSRAKLSRVV